MYSVFRKPMASVLCRISPLSNHCGHSQQASYKRTAALFCAPYLIWAFFKCKKQQAARNSIEMATFKVSVANALSTALLWDVVQPCYGLFVFICSKGIKFNTDKSGKLFVHQYLRWCEPKDFHLISVGISVAPFHIGHFALKLHGGGRFFCNISSSLRYRITFWEHLKFHMTWIAFSLAVKKTHHMMA